jgi:hypothetical protein
MTARTTTSGGSITARAAATSTLVGSAVTQSPEISRRLNTGLGLFQVLQDVSLALFKPLLHLLSATTRTLSAAGSCHSSVALLRQRGQRCKTQGGCRQKSRFYT